jgi:hypothetical protein
MRKRSHSNHRHLTIAASLTAVMLVSVVSSAAPSASAAALRAHRAPIFAKTRAFVRGTLSEGPKHTLQAIKATPVQYTAMLAAIGAAGAGAKAAGINPEPFALGLSGATFLWSSWKSRATIRAAHGAERLRLIGSHVMWPAFLVGATAIAGGLVGHGEAGHGGHASASDIARAGAQSVVIGIDVPTIAQTALANDKH